HVSDIGFQCPVFAMHVSQGSSSAKHVPLLAPQSTQHTSPPQQSLLERHAHVPPWSFGRMHVLQASPPPRAAARAMQVCPPPQSSVSTQPSPTDTPDRALRCFPSANTARTFGGGSSRMNRSRYLTDPAVE